MKIAHLGEKGSFSELAVRGYFGKSATTVGCADFSQVFDEVSNKRASAAVVPIENSMAGSIYENYDHLLNYNLQIIGEIYLNISHFLMALPATNITSLTHIYSHPQVLSQCKKFLKKHDTWECIPTKSTIDAITHIKKEKLHSAAAIASLPSSKYYNLAVLKSHVEDNSYNTTRFLILSHRARKKEDSLAPVKTSIAFSTPNEPGFLYKALSVFALRDINLLKIESRPMMSGKFEYIFYLDISGHYTEKAQQNALTHLQEITTMYRLLGSYPVGKTIATDLPH
jgi:prephenate dehydratase